MSKSVFTVRVFREPFTNPMPIKTYWRLTPAQVEEVRGWFKDDKRVYLNVIEYRQPY